MKALSKILLCSSQFTYASVVWLFQSRKISYHINDIYERVLSIIYNTDNNWESSFDELLPQDSSFKIVTYTN